MPEMNSVQNSTPEKDIGVEAREEGTAMRSISIVGLGSMARALAARALAGGNTVEIIGRDPARAEELAAALDGATVGTAVTAGSAGAGSAGGTAPTGDIVVLAVPYASAAAVVREYGDALRGKVIVDITNPVAPDLQGFVVPDDSSGAQEIAAAAPGDAHVVKAFNTLFSHVLAAGPAGDRPLDVFIAGDDAQAKARVAAFVESLGLRPWDTGALSMARALENVGLLEMGLVNHSVGHTDFSLGITLLG